MGMGMKGSYGSELEAYHGQGEDPSRVMFDLSSQFPPFFYHSVQIENLHRRMSMEDFQPHGLYLHRIGRVLFVFQTSQHASRCVPSTSFFFHLT